MSASARPPRARIAVFLATGFGLGYGQSSGYGKSAYARAWRPGMFRVR